MLTAEPSPRPPGLPPDVDWIAEDDGTVSFPPGTPQSVIAAAELEIQRAKLAASQPNVVPATPAPTSAQRLPAHPPIVTPPAPIKEITREFPVYAGWPHTVDKLGTEDRVAIRKFFTSEPGVKLLVTLRAARGGSSIDYIRGYEDALDSIYTLMIGPKPEASSPDFITQED